MQVNFVMGDNNLLGTDTQQRLGIPAGADYALGHKITSPAAPIVRLEVVIRSNVRGAVDANPTLANIHLVPRIFDPELARHDRRRASEHRSGLDSAERQLSAVVFDTRAM